MGVLLAATLILSLQDARITDGLLSSRELRLPLFIVESREPANFHLLDVRAEARERRTETIPHTIFGVKQHLGAAVGYDNGIVHESLGIWLTVAEWGRWNFGVPTAELGFSRYPVYDRLTRKAVLKSQPTVLISIASVHYRGGYINTFGLHWYVNLEQVYDMRSNTSGSQFGLSFSRK